MEPQRNENTINISIDTSCPKGLHIKEYEFDKSRTLTIRYRLSRRGGDNYWYVCKFMSSRDRPPHIPPSCDVWYWTDEDKWDWHTPKQYKTPQEAYDDVKDKI